LISTEQSKISWW